jgi:hypothetical protein
MLELNSILKKAESLTFSPSDDLKNKPSVVLLIFNEKKYSTSVRLLMISDSTNYKLVILDEDLDNTINISIIASHSQEVYNINNISFNREQFESFLQIQPQSGKFVFGTGYIENDEMIFDIDESNQKFILFNGYEVNKQKIEIK